MITERIVRSHFLDASKGVFMQFESGARSFHVCLDDRDFKLGDIIIFHEVEKSGRSDRTGRQIERKVIAVHRKLMGVDHAYLILGFQPPESVEVSCLHP